MKSLEATGPVISVSSLRGSGQEGDPVAEGLVLDLPFFRHRFLAETAISRIEVELGPAGPGQGPLLFCSLDEAVNLSDLKLHLGLFSPIVFNPFQKVVEKPFLQGDPVPGIELRPVFYSMDLKPFLF